jgi:predicted nuclease of predicted toxin-antitoxin system
MKVLVDAQLPQKLAGWFGGAGCDALHTLHLPDGNRSTDEQVIERAELDGRVVVSKDADFVNSHLVSGRPSNCYWFRPATSVTTSWGSCWCR